MLVRFVFRSAHDLVCARCASGDHPCRKQGPCAGVQLLELWPAPSCGVPARCIHRRCLQRPGSLRWHSGIDGLSVVARQTEHYSQSPMCRALDWAMELLLQERFAEGPSGCRLSVTCTTCTRHRSKGESPAVHYLRGLDVDQGLGAGIGRV
jgi:hypothetical protein